MTFLEPYGFIGNLQPTNSNVKLLECCDIFLRSFNLTRAKVKNTNQPCDDSANQRTLQKILHTPFARWSRDMASSPLQLKHKTAVYFFLLL